MFYFLQTKIRTISIILIIKVDFMPKKPNLSEILRQAKEENKDRNFELEKTNKREEGARNMRKLDAMRLKFDDLYEEAGQNKKMSPLAKAAEAFRAAMSPNAKKPSSAPSTPKQDTKPKIKRSTKRSITI